METQPPGYPSFRDRVIETPVHQGRFEETLPLTNKVAESIDLLVNELLSDSVTQLHMNGPTGISSNRNGRHRNVRKINFGSVEMYHYIINKFLLDPLNVGQYIRNDAFVVEGLVDLSHLVDPTSANPVLARIHIAAPPIVNIAQVTIAKKTE